MLLKEKIDNLSSLFNVDYSSLTTLCSEAYVKTTILLDEMFEDLEYDRSKFLGFSKVPGSENPVTGREEVFYGFPEIVVQRSSESFGVYQYDFDVDLNLTVHGLGSIIYRLVFGEPVGGIGLGVGNLIGSTVSTNLLKVMMLNMIEELKKYGYKGKISSLDIRRDIQDPTILRIKIEER